MRKLTQLRIDEVSAVLKGANPGARVLIRKHDADPPSPAYLFDDIMRKGNDPRSGQPPNSATDADKAPLSAQLDEIVAEMIAATGGDLHPDRARRWLLHTEQGQALLAQHTKKEEPMPQVNIMKLIEVIEEGLNAQVTPRDGESFAKAFSRKYETDEGYRRRWKTIQDARLDLSPNMSKSMPTLTPTSTDDSDEAVRLLGEMAAKNGQSFEAVFSNPANAKLAARTYTSAHRSSPSYGSEEQ
jgi:hypothetical protein